MADCGLGSGGAVTGLGETFVAVASPGFAGLREDVPGETAVPVPATVPGEDAALAGFRAAGAPLCTGAALVAEAGGGAVFGFALAPGFEGATL